jgi:hypothetical protein
MEINENLKDTYHSVATAMEQIAMHNKIMGVDARLDGEGNFHVNMDYRSANQSDGEIQHFVASVYRDDAEPFELEYHNG